MNAPLAALPELAARFGLRDLYAFGSRAREIVRGAGRGHTDPASAASDLDIGVQPRPGRRLSARDRVRLADDLERLFGVPRVDLVVLGEAPPFLAAEVVSGELLHTADPHEQAEHELYILRRAADLAPFRRERVAAVLSSGAR